MTHMLNLSMCYVTLPSIARIVVTEWVEYLCMDHKLLLTLMTGVKLTATRIETFDYVVVLAPHQYHHTT